MTSTVVRVGIVGLTVTRGSSGWGARAHAPALQSLPEVQLKALCTSREETARASAEAFGAELAFHDVEEMVAHPEVDLVVVSVRVPWHRDVVLAGLEAGKPVFCEWPLAANLAEAEELAQAARARSLRTMVGLQARSDPHVRHARELVAEGYVGEVLAASVLVNAQAITERATARIWQSDRSKGGNPLTIPGGHTLDAVCFMLGEITEVSARERTRTPFWHNTDTGEQVPVTSPDTIGVLAGLTDGTEVVARIITVPTNASGTRIEIHGREGSLLLTGPSIQMGPNKLFGARGSDAMAELTPPAHLTSVPDATPAGNARNVAQGYLDLAAAWASGEPFQPDFDLAVRRHRLIDAIVLSSDEGRTVTP